MEIDCVVVAHYVSDLRPSLFQSCKSSGQETLLAIMEPSSGKKRKKVRNVKKKQKSSIKASMTAEQKAEIRIKEKFTEELEIEYVNFNGL